MPLIPCAARSDCTFRDGVSLCSASRFPDTASAPVREPIWSAATPKVVPPLANRTPPRFTRPMLAAAMEESVSDATPRTVRRVTDPMAEPDKSGRDCGRDCLTPGRNATYSYPDSTVPARITGI